MENKEDKIRLIAIIVGVLLIGLSSILMFSNYNDKKEKKRKKEPYNPNEVITDSLTYSFLKLDEKKENFVYSPLSIKYALSMLNEGAGGNTKEELDKVLGDNTLTKYKNIDKVLSLANSIFIRDVYEDVVKESYTNTLKEKYNAEVFIDAFKSADKINKWIEDKTFGIIKNMLSDDIVTDPDVKVILVNALAIDMKWQYEFLNENTRKANFKVDEKVLDVAMMHMTVDSSLLDYVNEEDVKAVALPLREYEGVQLEFIAVMPENESLHDYVVADNFDENITTVLSKLGSESGKDLSISIPKFDFEYKLSLVDNLLTLGVKDVFSFGTADLTKIADVREEGKNLYVSEVLHKAKIEFSEAGIKAAAATVIIMKDSAAIEEQPREKININFDKPFMFIIRDKETKEVWFVGTVYEPLLWENVKGNYDYR